MGDAMSDWYVGWFLFAPVYVDMADEECPTVMARWPVLEPLVSVATWCQRSMIGFLSMCNDDYEPHFVIRLTGKVYASRTL